MGLPTLGERASQSAGAKRKHKISSVIIITLMVQVIPLFPSREIGARPTLDDAAGPSSFDDRQQQPLVIGRVFDSVVMSAQISVALVGGGGGGNVIELSLRDSNSCERATKMIVMKTTSIRHWPARSSRAKGHLCAAPGTASERPRPVLVKWISRWPGLACGSSCCLFNYHSAWLSLCNLGLADDVWWPPPSAFDAS